MSDIPEWALRRAGELMGYKTALHTGDSWWWTWESSLAFARYISEHEEPPVDPLTRAVDDAFVLLPPEWTRETFVASVTKTLRERGFGLSDPS